MTDNTILKPKDIVKVLLPLNTDGYDYIVPDADMFSVGDLVKVPLRGKVETGVIWGRNSEPLDYPVSKVKSIISRAGDYSLSSTQKTFVNRVAEYNMASAGNVLKMVMGFDEVFGTVRSRKKEIEYAAEYAGVELEPEQRKAADALSRKLGRGFSVTLLDGITGSGKTEVYFNTVAEALKPSDSESAPLPQILIMLPEISLTGQFLSKFEKRFGIQPVLWHSGLTPASRRENWKSVADGRARVVAGTRSALFLPFRNLRLIVLDEEHDSSYKQEDGVVYHGRDMAVLKASIEKIPIILASATPSIETLNNVRTGRYGEVRLKTRYGEASMPDIELIDMRGAKPEREPWGQAWLSRPLVRKIESALLNESQVMLYINRRWYAPLVLCSECGHRMKCPNCSVYLTAHKKDETRCFCHHCGYSTKLPPACPECGKEAGWALCGPGIERIEEEVRNRFPSARAITISSDCLTSQTRLSEIIGAIERREVDIIIGTQILVKGHHFPSLTLVGVVDGDMSFSSSDLRANENTFQILTQVSGRSGRGEKKGEVAIQTYNPDNPVMQAIKNNDRDSFVESELADRKAVGMPPFSKLAAVLASSKDKLALERFCGALARNLPVGLSGVQAFGPIDAPLAVINRNYRKRFLFIVAKTVRVQDILKRWLARIPAPSSVRVKIDIDPYNFM
ncbi:MAG: primosomal protein N' [Rickettsiales bacterium]|jgi:primosomal protein N' (replication factor Y)|nr:primosomal protein N' [Rickettsiales bacterium]